MHSSEHTAMAADLRNSPLHVFRVHENCKDYYYNINKTLTDGSERKEENLAETLKNNAPEVWALIYAANEKIALKAGLSLANGHKWHETARKKKTTQSPGIHLKNIYIKEKEQSSEERLAEFQKSPENTALIEMSTVGQHENDLYSTHRSDRLTASQFGIVCKCRITTPCHNHVKDILYKKIFAQMTCYMGSNMKIVAKSMFMQQYNKIVRPSGLFIDEEFGFFAGSPDGIIENERAVVEIKCFPSLARTNQSLEAAALEKKNFALKLDNNVLVMNKKFTIK
ncbi:unnamed protein product [Parnassius apollo]|uniref:(apollo) hypothetical protein n=1 Tax=Parnassius apollo TaxID=110799 RepID=A0A8S3XLX2_PARAO|nr:unnamed protein product [Parnassius apollo]